MHNCVQTRSKPIVHMGQTPIPEVQTCLLSLYIYPLQILHSYLPVMHSMWQGDMGICGIHIKFRHLTQWKKCAYHLSGLGQSRLSTDPWGKILTANPPPFSNICPRYTIWKVKPTIDRCIDSDRTLQCISYTLIYCIKNCSSCPSKTP